MNEISELREKGRYNLRHLNNFKIPLVTIVYISADTFIVEI